jgi:hypothetical protein
MLTVILEILNISLTACFMETVPNPIGTGDGGGGGISDSSIVIILL